MGRADCRQGVGLRLPADVAPCRRPWLPVPLSPYAPRRPVPLSYAVRLLAWPRALAALPRCRRLPISLPPRPIPSAWPSAVPSAPSVFFMSKGLSFPLYKPRRFPLSYPAIQSLT